MWTLILNFKIVVKKKWSRKWRARSSVWGALVRAWGGRALGGWIRLPAGERAPLGQLAQPRTLRARVGRSPQMDMDRMDETS